MNQKVYFIHIRKTAGTAMREQIAFNIPREQRCPELSEFELFVKHERDGIEEYLSQFDFFSGHYYTLAQYLPSDTFKFTILRDPISRCISEINHIYSDKMDLLHEYTKGMTKAEALDDTKVREQLENAQTKHLVMNAGGEYDSMSDSERLESAKKFLDELSFFGLQEQFETSIFLLSRELGWQLPPKIKKINDKITKDGMKIHHKIPFIGKIYNLNRLDIQLYKYAQKKFDKRVLNALKRGEK